MQIYRAMAVGGRQDGDPGPMVPHYGAQASGQRRFIGRRLDPSRGTKFRVQEVEKQGHGGIPRIVEVERRNAVFVPHDGEIVFEFTESDPHVAEYIRHLRDGDLIPADAETAKAVGVPFDPSYAKSLHRIYAAELAAEPEAKVTLADVVAKVQSAIAAPSKPGDVEVSS